VGRGPVDPRDRAVIAGELGRVPQDLTGVAVRCPHGYPAVTETAPVLAEGAPNPTLLYLTCPALATMISRVEAAGGVRSLRSACRDDEELRGVLEEITQVYQERRVALLRQGSSAGPRDPRLGAGIGGPESPEAASCLHAYGAALLAVMFGWFAPARAQSVQTAKDAWGRFLPPVEASWCTDRRCAKWDTVDRRAAIDVGTISVRLLVADLADGRPAPAARRVEITRLGEGLETGALLAPAARARTADAVARFVTAARELGAKRIFLAGTSASREAGDGLDFVRGLGREHDVEAAVISGDREAELTYAGARLDLAQDPVVLDVGGGSTELITRLESGRTWSVSLPLGASRATEQWIKNDPPTAEELDQVAREAGRVLGKVRGRFSAGPGGRGEGQRRLVGVAGTVTTLATLASGVERYDAEAIHLRTLALDEVCGLLVHLGSITTAERARLPGVQAGRAPVLVAGAAIVMAAMEVLGYQGLTVSERDLLDGLVMQGL
jgi:exopolyphosphatase/guanosine-5'-triphosphate,3'-diphosphate pyrophosphatase